MTEMAAPDKAPAADPDTFYRKLTELLRRLHEAKSFSAAFEQLEPAMLALFGAERISIYQRNRSNREIFCRYKTGKELKQIQVPISTRSLAGFVALSRKALLIADVYDDAALKKMHPKLGFDASFDRRSGFRSRSMMVVPIEHNQVLLGVLQVINRRDGQPFTPQELKRARELAQFMGQKFRYDFEVMDGPFDYLVKTGAIDPTRLQRVLAQGSKELSTAAQLKRDALLTSRQIGESLEHFYQVPFIPFDPDRFHPHPLQKQINLTYLRKNNVALLEGADGQVIILIDDPNDARRLLEVEGTLKGRDYEISVGIREEIQQYLGGTSLLGSTGDNLDDIVGELDDNGGFHEEPADDAVSEEAPTVVRLVNRILMDAKRLGASDIHIEPGKGKEPARVRMRLDGVCQEIIQIPASHVPATVSRIKIQSQMDISEKRKPQDGKFGIRIQGQLLEVRVATVPTVNSESVVMRLLATGDALRMEQLNLMPRVFEQIERDILSRPHGIFLVVGPTGSGKTSTLHAILGRLNSPEKKIWTAEDPVEITQPGLQQVQVQPKIGFDFAAALRAFLRADPDIILIGEMRDRETAHIGVEASLTGHLVLSTLHTNSAPETVTRLLDLGIDPVNFSDACLGILAQRLVRTLCPKCKSAYPATAEETAFLKRQYGEAFADELGLPEQGTTLYRAEGCEHCNMTGYRGRTGVHELLRVTPALREQIYRKATASELKRQAQADGMRTLLQDGIHKILKGDIDFQQLRQITAGD